ncbi:hypothetical protein M378DRAFT_213703 [Amanita muscaria Koide BX008]|uniref:Uncharacterized protein n=1 Tax=Amanita muscaria (strain Koide BX008) TaxID=946122 RepID=A0A0C2XAE5_AMAMK|nr:hypothetical protein M378DRAFT_213703 [Amanita muscaria Koide BX008]
MRITRGLDDIQGKLSDNAQMATTLLDLPLELLLHIGNELNTEPDDDLTLYKQLRLVCRAFDRAFAPIVLSNIRIFNERVQDTHLLAHQFYVLTRGSHRLSYVKSVSLGSWNWLYELHDSLWSKCERTKGMFWEVVRLIRLLQRICEARRRYDLKRDIKRRGCVSFQLANVQRLSWFVKATECTQSLRLNCQILKTLPSLTELSLKLFMCPDPTTFDIGNEIGLAVAQHRHLHKLIIRMVIGFVSREGSLDWLKRIIANNPDLTHLDLYQFGIHSPKLPSLSELLADVPPKHPLRLQHLRISTRFYQLTSDIVPHIRSLNSLHLWFPVSGEPHSMDDAWDLLREERIYVSEILTNRITLPLLDYLRDFNHLTALSIYEDGDTPSELDVKDLFQILEQHTLQRLKINPYDWRMWFQNSTSITKFSHLRELVLCSKFRLDYDIIEDDSYFWASTYEDLRIAEPVSQVETPVTIIMEGRFVLYHEFRLLCCASSSLSVRDLGRRMKYSKATFDMYDEWLVTIPVSS